MAKARIEVRLGERQRVPVVEVAIGSYGCDGSFQLFDVDTVERIMTHELGHSISLGHSVNPESMMYPSISNTDYAYCLLN